ncbi:MAG: hypothetical protein AB1758_29540, partial [Candidatus Eremiobacterota bacterium]
RQARYFWSDKPWDRPLSEFRDLEDFCRRLRALGGPVGEAAGRVEGRLDAMVLDAVGGGGLSLYMPDRPPVPMVEERYQALRLARDTCWDETLAGLLREAGPERATCESRLPCSMTPA